MKRGPSPLAPVVDAMRALALDVWRALDGHERAELDWCCRDGVAAPRGPLWRPAVLTTMQFAQARERLAAAGLMRQGQATAIAAVVWEAGQCE